MKGNETACFFSDQKGSSLFLLLQWPQGLYTWDERKDNKEPAQENYDNITKHLCS